MVGIVIGASSESIYTIQCAQGMGIYVIAIDGNGEAEGLCVADKSLVADIKDRELICDMLKTFKPIISLPIPIGRYLTTTGYINDYLGIKGISGLSAELCTDKYLFHKRLNAYGLRPISCQLVKSGKKVTGNIRNFPLILKPRFGSGSRGVILVSNELELRNSIEVADHGEDFVLEDAVQGTEYGVDGAVVNGEAQIILVRKKLISPPPIRQCVGYISIDPSEDDIILPASKDLLQSVVTELGMNHCLFHADLIFDEDKRNMFIIEISGRPSGHYLHNVFIPFATGVHVVEEYIRYILEGKSAFVPKSVTKAAIFYFDFQNCVIESIPQLTELRTVTDLKIIEYKCDIQIGDFLSEVTNGPSLMSRGYFVVQGDTEEDLNRQREIVLSKFRVKR